MLSFEARASSEPADYVCCAMSGFSQVSGDDWGDWLQILPSLHL